MRGPEDDFSDYQKKASSEYLKLAEERDEEARVFGEDEMPGSQFGMVSTLCAFAAAASRHAADQCSKAANQDEVDAIKFATRMLNDKLDAALCIAPANTTDWPH
jgi:hypothetical protein